MFVANEDYKKPSDKWFLLMAFAQFGPFLSREDFSKVFTGQTSNKAQDQQKSQLSKALKYFFGINNEPIPFSKKYNQYQPNLMIRTNINLSEWLYDMHE